MKAPADRRSFLRRALAAVAALFGVPAAASLVDPALKSRSSAWHAAGSASDLVDGGARLFSYETRTAWEKQKERAFLIRRGEDVFALGARCTHLGCTVRFHEGRFRCPCHGGVFSPEGEPLEGPVTEPLLRLETKVEDGKVFVKG